MLKTVFQRLFNNQTINENRVTASVDTVKDFALRFTDYLGNENKYEYSVMRGQLIDTNSVKHVKIIDLINEFAETYEGIKPEKRR